MNRAELSICVNKNGVNFGFLKETDIGALKDEVKEFVCLNGNVLIVSSKHINSDMEVDVDNVYTLSDFMNSIWEKKEEGYIRYFSNFERSLITEVYNIGETNKVIVEGVEKTLTDINRFRFSGFELASEM